MQIKTPFIIPPNEMKLFTAVTASAMLVASSVAEYQGVLEIDRFYRELARRFVMTPMGGNRILLLRTIGPTG
jgi:hypothetical protein